MDLFTALKVIVRRWYIVLSILVLSGVVTAMVVGSVPASYRANGSLIVASPGGSTEPDVAPNPFTNLDYSAGLVANIVAGLMQQKPAREKLVAAGADPTYVMGTPTGTTTPLISIEGTSDTPEGAIRTVKLILAATQEQLIASQRDAGAPPETWVRSIVLSSPVAADRLVGGKVRALVAISALGLAAAVSTAFIVDGIAVRRKAAPEDSDAQDEGSTAPVPPSPVAARTPQPRNGTLPVAVHMGVPGPVGRHDEPAKTRENAGRATFSPSGPEADVPSPETRPIVVGTPSVLPAAIERSELPVYARRHPYLAKHPAAERVPTPRADDEPPRG